MGAACDGPGDVGASAEVALLGIACIRGHEGEDEGTCEECPKELAGMLGSAHIRLVADPAFVDRACVDFWMLLANRIAQWNSLGRDWLTFMRTKPPDRHHGSIVSKPTD